MNVADLWDDLAGRILPELRKCRRTLSEMRVRLKPDDTFLTDADLAVQETVLSAIHARDPAAQIVAEEETAAALSADSAPVSWAGRVWVIDPIDGTSQFIRPECTEYCSVVCLVDEGIPTAALVLAPEIGPDRSAIRIQVDGEGHQTTINGRLAPSVPSGLRRASLTRSAATSPQPGEARFLDEGWTVKTDTTSQTLDMVRTCIDLRAHTAPELAPFALFYRKRQKVWDGAAGICLARAGGLRVTDVQGREQIPLRIRLDVPEPTLDSILVAPADMSGRLLAAWLQ
jgi:3'-phosphoadenosine 5'-phosphosulfate (PAPS) 3'-phosphatase